MATKVRLGGRSEAVKVIARKYETRWGRQRGRERPTSPTCFSPLLYNCKNWLSCYRKVCFCPFQGYPQSDKLNNIFRSTNPLLDKKKRAKSNIFAHFSLFAKLTLNWLKFCHNVKSNKNYTVVSVVTWCLANKILWGSLLICRATFSAFQVKGICLIRTFV